jgi:hypothetical protein
MANEVFQAELNKPRTGQTLEFRNGRFRNAEKFPRVDTERDAEVSIENFGYPEFDARRYGIVMNDPTSASKNVEVLNALGSKTWPFPITLTFPDGDLWINDTVSFTSQLVTLQGSRVRFRYSGPADRAAIVFSGGVQSGIFNLQLINNTTHDWTNQDFIGLRVTDTREQNLYIRRLQGFTINFQAAGITAGIGFNYIKIMRSIDALYHVDIHSISAATSSDGWINENEWHLESLDNTTSYPTDANSYGVRIKAESGAYTNINNNIFIKPSFELEDGDVGVERIPVVFDNAGSTNKFISCRVEDGRGAVMKVISDSFAVAHNVMECGYLDGTNFTGGSSDIVLVSNTDGGLGFGNLVLMQRFGQYSIPSWNSGNLVENAFPVTAAGRISIKGILFHQQSESPRHDGASSIFKDWIRIGAGSQGLGVFVDTSQHKEFELKVNTLEGCDVGFVCYDADGNILDNNAVGHPFVASSQSLTASTLYGYSYRTTSSNVRFIKFRVGSTVQKIEVLIIGPTHVNGFEIFAFQQTRRPRSLVVWSGFPGERLVDDSPATVRNGGYTLRGTIAYNDDAAASTVSYWQCTASGWNARAWANTTSYVINQMAENDSGKVYVCRVPGTSAGSGGPTGTGTGITDGAVVGDYIGTLATWTAGPSNP